MADTALADPYLPVPARIIAAREELPGVVTLESTLDAADGRAFAPGQFHMLYAFGNGEIPVSISGDPAETSRLIHTIRAVGAVSEALTRLGPGAVMGLRGPYGEPWPVETARGRHLIIVSGGLGLAPLRPALLAARARRGDLAGLDLVHGARSPADLLYPDQVEAWGADPGLDVSLTVDAAGRDWTGNVRTVPALLERRLRGCNPANVTAFLCGPEIMMRIGARALAAAGVPISEIWLSLERNMKLSLIHISEPTRPFTLSRMPSSA